MKTWYKPLQLGTITLGLLVLSPAPAQACAVCGLMGGGDSGWAYFVMSVIMSILPLGMIGGTAFWLYRRSVAHHEAVAVLASPAGPVSPEDTPHVPQHQDAVQLRSTGD